MKTPPLRFRQIHLDFHTGPAIPDVGRDFDAREFARVFKDAHVDSVTLFAKCHHGHLYYNTRRPERHPGLPSNLDLLGRQIEALHRLDIRAPIYLSVQCDEYAADHYPQWLARVADGRNVGAGPLTPGWQILDMSSPYQEYLAEQTREVLRKFSPVDGIFFDMCWDQPSYSNWAVDAMLKRGLDPEKETEVGAYAHDTALAYMKRFHQMIMAASPRATVYFNSRPLHNLAEEIPFLAQVEIEALPSGGWGYMYFPKNVRFARTFPRPYLGMTARFHKGWADFGGLKPYPALEYETSQMMAHGARCSIGDQLHPRGRLNEAAYHLIGRAYLRVKDHEPWLDGATSVTEIGLFQSRPGAPNPLAASGTDEGATRLLTQLRHQFDVVTPSSDLDKYSLLILPDAIPVDKPMATRLSAHLKRGGRILASGASGLNSDATQLVLKELGIKPHGLGPAGTLYMRVGNAVAADVPATDHVLYDRTVRVTPAPASHSVARIIEPYFQRSWRHFSSHFHTPPDRPSHWAAAVLGPNCAYVAFPVFASLATHGSAPYRLLVRNLIDKLLPDPLLRVDGPTGLEATVTRQKQRTIIHLLYYTPERRTPSLDLVEDIIPLYDVHASFRAGRRPKRAYLAPQRIPLDFVFEAGRINVCVPELRGHAMIVLEN